MIHEPRQIPISGVGTSKFVILTQFRGVVPYSYARMEDELQCVRERGGRS